MKMLQSSRQEKRGSRCLKRLRSLWQRSALTSICDEPTTALDVTIQAQILDLINELKEETGTSVMMITHDLGVIAEVADDVMVMYAGKVVEHATCDQIFDEPLHPYTAGLMNCIPRLDGDDTKELSVIEGMVPSFDDMPEGCAFCPRCPYAKEII